jgi:hypothetical protein
MNRSILARELKIVGVSLNGWLPVLQCDACKRRWEPFPAEIGPSAPTVIFDWWKCPNKCNATSLVSREIQTSLPRYVVINDIPGMVFGDEDLVEFERHARSMDATVVPNKNI